MLKEWLEVAEENNYVKPSYFQGQYNLVCRAYEDHLFPLLRKHSIHFNAFRYVQIALRLLVLRAV